MEIRFQTKEESNRQQQEEFLKLSGAERVFAFFRLMEQVNRFPVKNKVDKNKDNFQIIIKPR